MKNRRKLKLQASSIRTILVVAILVCIGIRFAWLSFDFGSLHEDPDAYKALAEGYATSGTFGRLNSSGVVTATAYRPPALVWLLSWFVVDSKLSDLAVGLLNWFFGGVTCCLVSRITFLLSGNLLTAAFACFCVAIDPILLKQSSQAMTETLATLVAVSLWWGWIELNTKSRTPSKYSVWMLTLGLIAGAGCLVRPTTIVWIACWFVLSLVSLLGPRMWRSFAERKATMGKQSTERPLILSGKRAIEMSRHESKLRSTNDVDEPRGPAQRFQAWLFFLLGMACVVTPWGYRNAVQIGRWTMTTTHGGYTILLANNPVLYENIRVHGWDRHWDETRFHLLWDQRRREDPRELEYWNRSEVDFSKALTQPPKEFHFGENGEHHEVSDDRLASDVAWKTISSNPSTFIKSCFVRTSWFWALTPYRAGVSGISSRAIGVWYSFLYLCFFLSLGSLLRERLHKRLRVNRLLLWTPAVALAFSLMLVHAIYWSNMRMRAPLMPSLYVFVFVRLTDVYSQSATTKS